MTGKTFVYFIQQGCGSIKIGVSSDPEKRLKTMQTGTSKQLRLLISVPFESRSEAFAIERELHSKYAHLRTRGEWFHPRFVKEFRKKGKNSPRLIGGTRNNPSGGLLGVTA
jgi:predicted GIY-YIG superfamily endonuclease